MRVEDPESPENAPSPRPSRRRHSAMARRRLPPLGGEGIIGEHRDLYFPHSTSYPFFRPRASSPRVELRGKNIGSGLARCVTIHNVFENSRLHREMMRHRREKPDPQEAPSAASRHAPPRVIGREPKRCVLETPIALEARTYALFMTRQALRGGARAARELFESKPCPGGKTATEGLAAADFL